MDPSWRTAKGARDDALTPSERRVAAMAGEGMGNREIAQALFVTLRTVASRTQLVDALAEQPGAGRRR